MLLVVSNSGDATADYGCAHFQRKGLPFLRLDTDSVVNLGTVTYRNRAPLLVLRGTAVRPSDISAVWFRRPEPLVFHVEGLKDSEHTLLAAEWQEALQGFLAHIPIRLWINHPARNAQASHKIEQLSRAEEVGLVVPCTLASQNAEAVECFWRECGGRVITKPLALGYLESPDYKDGVIYTSEVTKEAIADLGLVRACPTLFQQRIDKTEDVRVVAFDDNLVAIGMKRTDSEGQQILDIRRANMDGVRYRVLSVPADIGAKLRRLLVSYGLRFAAVDFAIDQSGTWVFLEINPNGQWAWLDLEAGANVIDAFVTSLSEHSLA